MNTIPQKILLVKNRGLGDSIMGLAAVSYLRQLFPQSHICYGVPSWVAPLYRYTQTPADSILPLSLTKFFHLAQFRPDVIFELHLSGRTYKFFRLFSRWRQIPYYYHNHHIKSGGPIFDQGVIKPLIQRDLDGIWSWLGQGEKPPHFLDFPPQLGLSEIRHPKKQIILGVVATRPAKMWPLEYFVQLAELIRQWDNQWEIIIPLSTGKLDQEIKQILAPRLPATCRLLEVSLEQLPRYLAHAAWYVGNDTGLKHLALALGARTYTLFGPEPPYEWHPYHPQHHPYRFIEQMPCRTLTGHFCGRYQCAELFCLKQITPQMVFEDLKSLLTDGEESLGMVKIRPSLGVE